MTNEISQLEEKIRNNELYALLKDLASSFMDALNIPFVSEYGSWRDRLETLVLGGSNMVAEILLLRRDLDEKKLCKCLLEVDRSLKFIIGNRDISRKPPHASAIDDLKVELSFFLSKLLEEKDRLLRQGFYSGEGMVHALSRSFVREYLKYEEYLYNDNVFDFVICPIENFIGPQAAIDFGGYLEIRKINQEEFHNLVEALERCERGLISYPEFIIYMPSSRDWMSDLVTIATTFRLLKKGEIGLRNVYYGYAFPFKPWRILEPPPETKFYREKSVSLYEFKNAELEEVVQLFSTLESVRNVKYISVALHRYNLAYQRDTNEDRFIDYFVSLESLFTVTGERGEVTHKISTRAARVLAESFEERQKLQSKIKKLYGYRSGIIHGELIRLKQSDVDDLEDIVRTSLKWFISQSNFSDHTRLISEIDL